MPQLVLHAMPIRQVVVWYQPRDCFVAQPPHDLLDDFARRRLQTGLFSFERHFGVGSAL